MKCIKCNAEIESDDNFCHNCSNMTPHGYLFFKDINNINIVKGLEFKQSSKFINLTLIFFITLIVYFCICFFMNKNVIYPFVYLKKQLFNYRYGYNYSLIKNDNQYYNIDINNLDDAKDKIYFDLYSQAWQCNSDSEVNDIEYRLENKYDIPSVVLCDVSSIEAKKIYDVIEKMYILFPSIKGYLTNITITNSCNKDDYIAYFQPIYQFVNSNKNIDEYNLVNKTQILLNSYYFINDSNLNIPLKNNNRDNWYVKDATFESLIAHEFGHYISFVALLKEYNIDNIVFVNKDNYDDYNMILNILKNGSYSKKIIEESLNNYNNKYNVNLDIRKFASNISLYANKSDKNGNLLYDETIAEAVHDYFLHGDNAKDESILVVDVLRSKL